MSKTDQRNRSQKMAADLIARGYPHGRRRSRPYPNSGGTTMVNAPGSSRYHRYVASTIGRLVTGRRQSD